MRSYPKAPPAAYYVLQDVASGHYISTEGETPALQTKPALAFTRPATVEGLTELVQEAANKVQRFGIPFEIQRIEPLRAVL